MGYPKVNKVLIYFTLRGTSDREVTRDPRGHKRHTGYIRHRGRDTGKNKRYKKHRGHRKL